MVEHLGQRVLQQRQCAGPIGHLPNQGRHERRLERDAERLRRAGDRPFQVERCHRRDDLGPVAEQFAEGSVLQRPVVEVGSKRDDHADATLLVGDGADQAGEEPVGRRRVDLCEELLELVDEQQQLRAVGGQHPVDRALQPLVADELFEQRRRGVDGHVQEGVLELLERMGCRGHLDREPRT